MEQKEVGLFLFIENMNKDKQAFDEVSKAASELKDVVHTIYTGIKGQTGEKLNELFGIKEEELPTVFGLSISHSLKFTFFSKFII